MVLNKIRQMYFLGYKSAYSEKGYIPLKGAKELRTIAGAMNSFTESNKGIAKPEKTLDRLVFDLGHFFGETISRMSRI